MAQTPNQRRASDAVAAWLARHHRNPAWLVDATGADPGTISDFLNGVRWPKLGTQGRIEDAVGWPSGTIRQIANGAEVPAFADSAGDVEDPEPDTLLFRRPAGLTDAQWAAIKRESRGFVEWQIQKTMRRD